ncbi:MAG: 2-hydroxyacyl-CoA dehydratase [Desulfatibacillaceae bacterium]
MRPEMHEYNLDWMLASTVRVASSLDSCSDRELEAMFRYIPYFGTPLHKLVQSGRPGMQFIKMLDDYLQRVVTARDRGRMIGMTTFCFCPLAMEACGIVPLMLENITGFVAGMYRRGAHDYMDYCVELGFSETGCSSQRGMLGAYLAGLGEDIGLVVGSMGGVCDSNSNAYAFASEKLGVPFYNINYPAQITGREVWDYQRRDYEAMISFLEEVSGNRLDEDMLRGFLEEKKKQDAIVNEIEEMQMLVPNPLKPIYLLLIYSGNLMCPGWPAYTEVLESIREAVRDNAEKRISGLSSGHEANRTLFFYIDHTGLALSFWSWLDEHGVSHLGGVPSRSFGDEAPYAKGEPGTVYHIDTSSRDAMIDSLVGINATMPMSRTIRGPHDAPHMWLEDTLRIAELYNADSCVYAGTPGCRNTWSNVRLMARELEKAGYPTHIMYSDTFDMRVESWETTSARLEEFYRLRGLWPPEGAMPGA